MRPEAISPAAGRLSLPPSAATAAAPARSAADEAIRFTVAILILALPLQRFAVPVAGEVSISIAGPLGLLCGVYWVWRGALVVDRRRFGALLALIAVGMLAALTSLAGSSARFATISWLSLAQFLLVSTFAVLAFREPVDESRFFAAVNGCLAIVGVAGILQFFAQLARVSVFMWSELGFPIAFTLEGQEWNVKNPSGVAGLFKSNGLFLAEPSIFSQMMALALAIELVFFRRLRYLAIFALGLMVSVSGTDWLVFGAFVAGVVVRLGWRGVAIGVGALALGVLMLGALAFVSPDLFEAFSKRINEFSAPGNSGHSRFVTPWWVLSDVVGESPGAFLIGAGAGTADAGRLATRLPYLYDLNAPLKVLIEYGALGLIAYSVLFLAADRTPRQTALLLPVLVLFGFAGSWAQFPPVLFPVLLITSVARLRPTPYRSG